MRYLLLAFALLFATGAQAADLAGTWRSDGPVPRALVIKKDKAGYRGLAHVLDHDRDGTPLSAVSGKDGAVRISLDRFADAFSGKFAADGKFSGSWKNGEGTKPITFIRLAPDWKFDPSPHRQRFVQVEKGITLEVLDWGGNGPALVLLPGLGNSAHVFDELAPKLTAKHHVYGITRRGFGQSDLPPPTPENYDSDRLGDDALAVLNALKIKKAVLAGHSMGGAELSSVATRHPERVAGLVYLDAGYGYALYVPGPAATAEVDVNDLRRALTRLPIAKYSEIPALLREIRGAMARVEKAMGYFGEMAATYKDSPADAKKMPHQLAVEATLLGEKRYTSVKSPILAIYATPAPCDPSCKDPVRLFQSRWSAEQADAVRKAYPKARVVRIPLAQHYVFRSHEAEVIRHMNAFMDGLPR